MFDLSRVVHKGIYNIIYIRILTMTIEQAKIIVPTTFVYEITDFPNANTGQPVTYRGRGGLDGFINREHNYVKWGSNDKVASNIGYTIELEFKDVGIHDGLILYESSTTVPTTNSALARDAHIDNGAFKIAHSTTSGVHTGVSAKFSPNRSYVVSGTFPHSGELFILIDGIRYKRQIDNYSTNTTTKTYFFVGVGGTYQSSSTLFKSYMRHNTHTPTERQLIAIYHALKGYTTKNYKFNAVVRSINPTIYYDFNENHVDKSGNGYDATVTGTPLTVTTSLLKYSNTMSYNFLEFAGHVDINQQLNTITNTAYSIGFITRIHQQINPIASNQHILTLENRFSLYHTTVGTTLTLDVDGASNVIYNLKEDMETLYVFITHNGSDYTLYINGEVIGTSTAALVATTTEVCRLCSDTGGTLNYDGVIDEFMAFDSVLSDENIKRLYDNGININYRITNTITTDTIALVRLYKSDTGELVEQTRTDSVNFEYVFNNLEPDVNYDVIAYAVNSGVGRVDVVRNIRAITE